MIESKKELKNKINELNELNFKMNNDNKILNIQ